MATTVLRGAKTTKLAIGDLRVTFVGGPPPESWSWNLACVKYEGAGAADDQKMAHAQYFGAKFLMAGIVLDDPLIFDEGLANLAANIVLLSRERQSLSADVFFEGNGDPIVAADCVRTFFTQRIGRNATALTIADNTTLGFIDVLLDRRPGALAPSLLRGAPVQSCMVTLQNDQYGDPQITQIKPDIFGVSEPMSRKELDALGNA